MINNIEEEVNSITSWIKEYVEKTKSNGLVIGNSGGKDSATVIGLATKAIGKENVLAVSMPCNSIGKDLDDAKLVAKTFDVKNLEIDLTSSYDEIENAVLNELKNKKVSDKIEEEAKINAKPRLRMLTLYMVARTNNYLVMGTGNKCEIFVGYTTKWGDSASDFNPLANYTVDEVLEIGKFIGVPDEIINKAPNDGLGGKTDEQKMGVTYKEIAEYMETGTTKNKNSEEIIKRMHNVSEHKRNLVPIYERKNNK